MQKTILLGALVTALVIMGGFKLMRGPTITVEDAPAKCKNVDYKLVVDTLDFGHLTKGEAFDIVGTAHSDSDLTIKKFKVEIFFLGFKVNTQEIIQQIDITGGQENSITLQGVVPSSSPKGKYNSKAYILGENDEELACASITFKIE